MRERITPPSEKLTISEPLAMPWKWNQPFSSLWYRSSPHTVELELAVTDNEYASQVHHGRELVLWYEDETRGMIPDAAGSGQ